MLYEYGSQNLDFKFGGIMYNLLFF